MTLSPGTARIRSPMFTLGVLSMVSDEITEVVTGESTSRTAVRRPTGRRAPSTTMSSATV